MKKAQSLIEYTLILFLISAIAVATLHFLGKKASLSKAGDNDSVTQNIIDTMTNYCESKGLVYNIEEEKCEEPDINSTKGNQ